MTPYQRKPFSVIATLLLFLMNAFCISSQGGTTETMEFDLGSGKRAILGAPVVVCASQPGETRWGYHQFAVISEYPGGGILLRHHAAEDAVSAYGAPLPTYLSRDQGKTWQSFNEEGLPANGITCPLLDGHFICVPMAKALDAAAEKIAMPEPVGTTFSYCNWRSFRVNLCPEPVQRFMKYYEAARWDPKIREWKQDQMIYDTKDALVWSPGNDPKSTLLSRTCFERPPLRVGNELLFADYRSNFIQEDGTIPIKWGVTCMVSQDNGKSWMRRATIALDREGKDALTEPMLAKNVKGELACVMRRTDQEQKSMCITYSSDQGRTWEKPANLDKLGKFGVFPALITLDCGVMVLCYGRPGIHLSFSTDGAGRNWSDPFCMLPGDPAAVWKCTDGYTCMLPIDANRLLIAYTDFEYKDAEGLQRKAILVRTLTIQD
ncbi:exo-alpha-sialidase [Candidatus Sumerlaeota bacterium]|nr:exo-alpha-sialidase [Candidatus Sumerlaeota bacterium]